MAFLSAGFVAFLVAAVVGHLCTRHRRRAWIAVQIALSIVFVGLVSPELVALYGAVTAWTWWWARRIGAGRDTGDLRAVARRRRVGVAGVVVVLALTKYVVFVLELSDTVAGWFGAAVWLPERWWAPVGISFLAFQSIAVLCERARGTLGAITGPECALVCGLFPKAFAGPLVRPSAFVGQLRRWPRPVFPAAPIAALVVAAVVKKAVLAEVLFDFEAATANPDVVSGLDATARLIVAPLRVYCDVSAYADLAIATAMLLGIALPANFDRPFAAASVSQYWRRWHMTVSAFFREYVFDPLRGGRRARTGRVAAAAVATMALSGLWHGAGVTFVLWGVLHGGALAVEGVAQRRAADRRRDRRRGGERVVRERHGGHGWRRGVRWAATFSFVCVTGVLFADVDVPTALARLGSVAHPWSGPHQLSWPVVVAAACVLGAQFAPAALGVRLRGVAGRAHPVVLGAVVALVVTLAIGLNGGGIPAFVYFRF